MKKMICALTCTLALMSIIPGCITASAAQSDVTYTYSSAGDHGDMGYVFSGSGQVYDCWCTPNTRTDISIYKRINGDPHYVTYFRMEQVFNYTPITYLSSGVYQFSAYSYNAASGEFTCG